MCNLSDGIEQRAIKKGISQGISQGINQGISKVVVELLKANQPIDLIAKCSEFSKEKIAEIAKQNGIAVTF